MPINIDWDIPYSSEEQHRERKRLIEQKRQQEFITQMRQLQLMGYQPTPNEFNSMQETMLRTGKFKVPEFRSRELSPMETTKDAQGKKVTTGDIQKDAFPVERSPEGEYYRPTTRVPVEFKKPEESVFDPNSEMWKTAGQLGLPSNTRIKTGYPPPAGTTTRIANEAGEVTKEIKGKRGDKVILNKESATESPEEKVARDVVEKMTIAIGNGDQEVIDSLKPTFEYMAPKVGIDPASFYKSPPPKEKNSFMKWLEGRKTAPASNPVKISSESEYNKLPGGSSYEWNGKVYTKQ